MPQVARKQDFIGVDCKQLKAKLEDFTSNLEDFQQYIEDVAQENIRLRIIVSKLDAIVALPRALRISRMEHLLDERQDALRLPTG